MTLLVKIRGDYMRMLASEGINVNSHYPHMFTPTPTPLLTTNITHDHLNILWARMTYITDELALVCPPLGNEQGLRNIVIGYMERYTELIGNMPETIFMTPQTITRAEKNWPVVFK
jgi:hypothetical protein